MLLYHGSERILEKPVYGSGRADNDYGRGFYCTEDKELAKEWACQNGLSGYANAYSFDTSGLSVLKMDDSSVLQWLSVLVRNRMANEILGDEAYGFLRRVGVDTSRYDVMIGYRADDSFFTFAKDFLKNTIPLDVLKKALMLGELGRQVMVQSEKAFDRLVFQGAEKAEPDVYYRRFVERDSLARARYQEMKIGRSMADGVYLVDLVRASREFVSKDAPSSRRTFEREGR